MRRMKDSGIEWIGLIPESWEINKLRNCASFIQDKYDNNLGNLSYIGLENIVSWNGKYIETESVYDKTQTLLFVKDDILWGKLRPYLAKVYHAKDVGCCSSEFCVIRRRPDLLDKRYFWNLLISSEFVSAVNRSTYGTKMPRANPDYIKNIMIPTPTIEEQQRIANFLDAECAQIDAIIEQTRATVEEYKKLKQSIITQAVTKGIRPNRPMKDCGIEWIGEIPEEWKVIKVKWILKERNERSLDGTEEPLSMSQKFGLIPTKEMTVIPNIASSFVGAKLCYRNDLVFNKLKAHLGVFAVSQFNGLVSPDYAVYYSNDQVILKYLEYLFKTPQYIGEFRKKSTGVGAGLTRLYTEGLYSIYCSLPPLNEQNEIINHIKEKTEIIDNVIDRKEGLILELESYKKSLIYEYVTGKKEAPL